MAVDYIKLLEARARQELEQLAISQQRAIIEAYNSAGKELVRQYRGAKDGTATKALYASYTKKIADETQQIIEQYAIEGAQVAPSVEKLIMQQAFQMAGLDTSVANDKFENLIGKLGMESVKNVIGGKIYKDGAGLSSRVWQASAMANNRIQEVVAAGLAQNLGAAKMSKLLQAYVNPAERKNWDNEKIKSLLGDGYAAWNKNLEYNALRLARTTLSHTATMSMRQAQKVNPYADKIKWHSVHAAGRTCSTCEEMDGNVYDTDKCPFDHPNGMCYQTHEMDKSLDEIADELAAWCKGEENEMLDNWWKSIGGKDEKPAPKPSLVFRRYTDKDKRELTTLHKSWESSVPREQKSAAKAYIGDTKSTAYNYEKWNSYMRGQSSRLSASDKKNIEELTALTKSCTTQESFIARRGTNLDAFYGIIPDDIIDTVSRKGTSKLSQNELDTLVSSVKGATFQDPAFMSTSYNTSSAFYRDCTMEIKVPKGSNCGAFISSFGTRDEDEFLIAPNTPMIFEDCSIDKNGAVKIIARLLV